MPAKEFAKWLCDRQDPKRAKQTSRFFQVLPGGYAEHDRFLGIAVPVVREGVKAFRGLSPAQATELVRSSWHEIRMAGLLSWVDTYARCKSEPLQGEIAKLYLENRGHIDNWDLVDCSAHLILGPWWENHPDPTTFWSLVESPVVWDRRIAVLSTFHGIRNGQSQACLDVCEALLGDRHDLIHKATGWMLREAGKRDLEILREFLRLHVHRMPRTMLRYAIEKLTSTERAEWMEAKKMW